MMQIAFVVPSKTTTASANKKFSSSSTNSYQPDAKTRQLSILHLVP